MKLKIGDILQDQSGRLHDVEFSHEYTFSDEYTFSSPLHFEGQLLRDSEGVLVIVNAFSIHVLLPCEFCDTHIEREITLEKPIERRFVIQLPADMQGEEVEDVFVIDMHHHTIDLTEMLRQEVELRIPFGHACTITNGMCSTCGKEVFTTKEEVETPREQQPFAHLKDLFKE